MSGEVLVEPVTLFILVKPNLSLSSAVTGYQHAIPSLLADQLLFAPVTTKSPSH